MQAIVPSDNTLRKELEFVRDDIPGIARKRRGKYFYYLDPAAQ
jgi:DNA topoisomerase IB